MENSDNGFYRDYIGIIGCILGLYRDNVLGYQGLGTRTFLVPLIGGYMAPNSRYLGRNRGVGGGFRKRLCIDLGQSSRVEGLGLRAYGSGQLKPERLGCSGYVSLRASCGLWVCLSFKHFGLAWKASIAWMSCLNVIICYFVPNAREPVPGC